MKINGHPMMPGCVVDGFWGQYGYDRLAEWAEALGAPLDELGDPREERLYAESLKGGIDPGSGDAECDAWDRYTEAGQKIEDWLEDHCDGCYVGWADGEFYVFEKLLDRLDEKEAHCEVPDSVCD